MAPALSNVVALSSQPGAADSTPPMPSTAHADADAMRRLARGEIGALGEIYDRHHEAIRRFIARATGSLHDADDLVHTTFLTLPKIAASFDESRSCRAWLLGIAARVLRKHRATGARLARALLRFRQTTPLATPDPERALAARRELSRLERALLAMSEAKRVVLIMAEVEGLSCEEIASALEIPIGTVWTRLHHARRALEAALLPEGES
jgi:RNA polymerase sigma-70 factor, ECF subfamily